jgi:putative nucleotidyltransferase with HDIG domain
VLNLLFYIRAKHNLLLKLFVVGVCAFIMALLHPKKEVKGFRPGKFDRIWTTSDLICQKPLYISKTKTELEKEYEDLAAEDPVFLDENLDERNEKLKEFQKLSATSHETFLLLKPWIDSIYARGISETLEEALVKRPLFITRNNFSEQSVYYDLFTASSAIDLLKNKLELHPENKFNLNELASFVALTLFYDNERTSNYSKARRSEVSLYSKVYMPGDVIIRQGEELTEEKRNFIEMQWDQLNETGSFSFLKFLASWLLYSLLLMLVVIYLAFFRRNIFGQNKQVVFLIFSVLAAFSACAVLLKYDLQLLALPFCLVPIIVRVFFDSRTALFTHLIAVLCCSFFSADKLEFILLQLTAGIGTLFAVAEMRKRQQLITSAIYIFVIYLVMSLCYKIMVASNFGWSWYNFVPFAISSLLVLLAYPLIFFTERVFGFISDYKLLELSDLNQPLLRRLSQEIPGTFQHSLQVANLAEEVIYYIGGNSLLVRTGAMYHDIGKLYNPKYFTENQMNGFSPHIEMQPLESAKVIIDHVIKGIELAKEYQLPDQLIDFIRTHHGTTFVGYFLSLYKKEKKGEEDLENEFRYPGPIPFSKETAVLMLADAVEASSRSLKVHDAPSINELVDSIIDYKISLNQLINSDITFKDITLIKKVFKKRLMNIYHVRIEYPAQVS